LPTLMRAEPLVRDYERTGLSVSDHPMRILRPTLPRNTKSAKELAHMPHGARVSAAGLVICRQRPMTASGVVFVTMEDEDGFINAILYAHVFERFRHVATTSPLLVVRGKIEREGDVVYVIAEKLERLSMQRVPSMSRDFH